MNRWILTDEIRAKFKPILQQYFDKVENLTVKQVENISNAYDNAAKSAEKLADAQSKIGNKSNISSDNSIRNVLPSDSEFKNVIENAEHESKALNQAWEEANKVNNANLRS